MAAALSPAARHSLILFQELLCEAFIPSSMSYTDSFSFYVPLPL